MLRTCTSIDKCSCPSLCFCVIWDKRWLFALLKLQELFDHHCLSFFFMKYIDRKPFKFNSLKSTLDMEWVKFELLTTLSLIFQLYRGDQFYWWGKNRRPVASQNFITRGHIEYTRPVWQSDFQHGSSKQFYYKQYWTMQRILIGTYCKRWNH